MTDTTTKTILVHREGHEGTFQIDAMTGQVLNTSDLPEWAEGLAVAQLTERAGYYIARLGRDLALETALSPTIEALAFEDLGWLALDPETGDEASFEADEEHRMSVLSGILGMSRDATDNADLDGSVKGAIATLEVSRDNAREDGEMQALEEAQKEGFERATGTA